MSWRDATRLALRELRRRPGRALLTVLAVVLAAALLVALLAISQTAKTRVLTQLSHGGALAAVSVVPYAPDPAQENLDNPVTGPPRAITSSAVAAMSHLPGVSRVLPVSVAGADGFYRSPASAACHTVACAAALGPVRPFTLLGLDLSDTGLAPVTVLAGRLPARRSDEVDVTQSFLQLLGLHDSQADRVIGGEIEAASFPASAPVPVVELHTLEIVGVVDQQLGSGSILGWDTLTLDEFARTGAKAGPDPQPRYVGVVVVSKDLAQVSAVRAGIAAIGYSSDAPEGLIVSVTRYLQVVELVLSGIGLTALVIAALGIANALLAAVRERRREIGVLKAIGGRDGDVVRTVVVEAAAIGLLGGLVGTATGMGIAALIGRQANDYLAGQGLAGVQLLFPWQLPVAGALGATVVAVAAGLPAAWRAARLPARGAVDS